MVGLILVAHAGLAKELLAASEMVVGKIENAVAIGINPDDQVETIMEQLTEATARLSDGGLIIMTDMFGGTPSNLSLSFLAPDKVEVMTGVNLPMVVKFASERERYGFADLAKALKECGRESIAVAGDYLK